MKRVNLYPNRTAEATGTARPGPDPEPFYPASPGAMDVPAPRSGEPVWARWWNLWLAEKCLVVSIFGAIFCFVNGGLVLSMLSDPLFRNSPMASSPAMELSIVVLAVYFIVAAVVGIGIAVITIMTRNRP